MWKNQVMVGFFTNIEVNMSASLSEDEQYLQKMGTIKQTNKAIRNGT